MPELISQTPEIQEREKFTDLVVIRPPKDVPNEQTAELVSNLESKGFMPYVQPRLVNEWEYDFDVKWFPTDAFRDLGGFVLINNSRMDELDQVFKNLPDLAPDKKLNIESRLVEFPLAGGNYLHLNDQKVFIYDPHRLDYPDNITKIKKELAKMTQDDWKVYEVSTAKIGYFNKFGQDLDFWMSLFVGKDGKAHAIAAERFADRVPKDFMVHTVPEEEGHKGGCNIADLRNGTILVAPNHKDTPTTHQILNEFSKAKILETPPGFIDGGGGPRCSISAISL